MPNPGFTIISRTSRKLLQDLLFFSFFTLLLVPGTENCFAQDHKNDWFYNPFNQYSAHHRPIGTGAIYADEDHPAVQDWLKRSQINLNLGTTPWGLFFVASDEDGTVKTVTIRECSPINPGLFPVDVRFPYNADDIMPHFPCDRDGSAAVYDRIAGTYHEFFRFGWYDGNPKAAIHRSTRLDDLGHGTRLAERIGTSASGVALAFGLLRGWEVRKEGHPIGHALHMAIPRTADSADNMLGREVWWPSTSMDGSAYTNPSHNTGNIPYGSLWAIPPVSKGGPDLDTLGLTEKGKRLAEAIRDYGIYVVDGGAAPSIRCDQDFSQELRNEMVMETRKFYQYLRMVKNSVPDEGKVVFNVGDLAWSPSGPIKQIIQGEFPAGGGTPLAPNTAIDAVTSVEERIAPANKPRIFPNPTKGNMTIHLGEQPCTESSIVVINPMGQIIVQAGQITKPSVTIELPDGNAIYFVRITSGTMQKTIKIVKL